MADFTYSITEHIASLSDGTWELQLNKISWNKRPATFDLRKWNVETDRMGKGCTFTEEEALALRNALNAYFGEGEES